jgi:formylmethanofuran:tetrahydromethanopterin formyltransferase
VALSVDLDKVLDKQWEDKLLQDILAAPVTALAGVTDSDAEHLAAAFNIRTVQDLGSNKYFAAAGVLVALSRHAS